MTDISSDTLDRMYEEAIKVREFSYSPYSGFKVGASVMDSGGRIYTGTNIESSSFGLTVCAERNAIYSALGKNSGQLRVLLIVADTKEPVVPCGSCRQVIYDHAPEMKIILSNIKGDKIQTDINELFKKPFSLKIKS